MKWLNVALPKGRLGDQVYRTLARSGYSCHGGAGEDRRLILENPEAGVRYYLVKPSDVAVYVERGAADAGIVGRDVLLEAEPDVYEMADLKMVVCRMCVAGRPDFRDDHVRPLRVATKYPRITRRYYSGRGRQIELIKLNGSIELAPLVDLADVIVDIVETGTTLKENGLAVLETVLPVSARFIANKASMKFKEQEILAMCRALQEGIET